MYDANLPSGSTVAVSSWNSSVVVTGERREESYCRCLYMYDANLPSGSAVVVSSWNSSVVVTGERREESYCRCLAIHV